MKLIICEKPSVSMDYAKVLGLSNSARKNGYLEEGEWIITWAVGHLVSLSYPEAYDESLAKWRMEDLPFIPENFKYSVIKDVKDQFNIVKGLLQRKDVEIIYNAGDAGREGEYIQRLIFQMAKPNPKAKILRIWIDSTTEEAVKNGIRDAKPASEYDLISDAAYERGIEDYLSGINFSRAYSLRYGTALNKIYGSDKYIPFSVGRVMTTVLGMVVEREQLIRNFQAKYSYGIDALLENNIEAEWFAAQGSAYFESPLLAKENAFFNKSDAEQLTGVLNSNGTVKVLEKQKKTEKKKAPTLFNLAELQAECSRLFKISPAETLDIAQSLYEKKLTTYPRTDARVVSSAVAAVIDKNVNGISKITAYSDFVNNINASGSIRTTMQEIRYVDDSKITDHYAIIPTGDISALGQLDQMEKQIYDLICRRFLAIFYPTLDINKIAVLFGQNNELFKTYANKIENLGWKAVTGFTEENDEDDQQDAEYMLLDSIEKGQCFNADFTVTEKKSAKPKRYSSGNLILAMENAGKLIEDEELRNEIAKDGIGTSATRGETVKKLIKNKYIALNDKTQIITPTELGEMIYCVVQETIPNLLNPAFTANWEKGLSQITRGEITAAQYRSVITNFIRQQTNVLKNNDRSEIINQKLNDIHVLYGGKPFDFSSLGVSGQQIACVNCPNCGKAIIKTPWGFKCAGYKDTCSFTIGEICGVKISDAQLVKILTKGESDKMKFKKKDGKTFEASLKIIDDTDTHGKKIGFSFAGNGNSAHVAKETECTCPDCRGKIITTPWGFKCEACNFSVGEIGGVKISQDVLSQILNTGSSDEMTFQKKNGTGTYKAKLTLQDNEKGGHKIWLSFN